MAKTILVVDDDLAARDGLSRLLSTHGFHVRTACDSHEANYHMAHQPADVVLLDIGLPYIPGDSIATFLKLRYPQTRIIFISGEYNIANPERFGQHTRYLRKPIDINQLLEWLGETAVN